MWIVLFSDPHSCLCPLTSVVTNRLDPDPAPLEARIVNRDPENLFAASGDVRDVDPQGFQTGFQLFDGEVIFVQHAWFLSLGRTAVE